MPEETTKRLRRAQRQAHRARQVIEQMGYGSAGRKALSNVNADISQLENEAVYKALLELAEPLAKSYAQVKLDLKTNNRSSWAGTAHEIREVLANMLRLLAPDEKVLAQMWYRQEQNTLGPTQKQRVRYILQQHSAGSKEQEVVEQVSRLEEMIGDIVRATYSRASDAAHRFKTRKEVGRIVTYFDAFARDLLNID